MMRTSRQPRAIHACVVTQLVLAGIAAFLPEVGARAILVTALVASALFTGIWVLRRRSVAFPAERTGLLLLAAAMSIYLTLYVIAASELAIGRQVEVPRALDLSVLLAFPLQTAAVLVLPGAPRGTAERLRAAIDGIIFALALFCLQWLLGVGSLPWNELVAWFGAVPFLTASITLGAVVSIISARPGALRDIHGWFLVTGVFRTANNLAAFGLLLRGTYAFGDRIDLLTATGVLITSFGVSRHHRSLEAQPVPRAVNMVAALLPYLPVIALLAVLYREALNVRTIDPFIVQLAYLSVLLVIGRQFLTVLQVRNMSASLEATVKERTAALTAAHDELARERRLEALGRLAGGVAHDFNNLLSVVSGYAHLAAQAANGRVTECAAEIQRAVDQGALLTRQIMEFARKGQGEPVPFSPVTTLRNLEPLLQRVVGDSITLELELDPDTEHVEMDPGQLERVLVNLVANARDAMPRGGRIVVRARNRQSPGDAPEVCIEVRDEGQGMSRETLERLFEPFFTTKAVGQGTGLGLASSHGIVQQAHGRIEVESALERGSRLTVVLPAASTRAAVAAPAVEAAPTADARAGETVLLAEDAPALRSLLESLLRYHGYRVLAAANGDDAVTIAANYTGPIDAMVTDVSMPGRSGLEAARAVAARRTGLAVIAMSGQDAADPSGFPNLVFLAKPFTPRELLRKLRETLDAPDTVRSFEGQLR